MSIPMPKEKNPSGSPLPIGRRTIDVRGSENAPWPFELTQSPVPRAAHAKRPGALAVRDEGQEEQPERQEQGDQPPLDQRVADSFGEAAACGHYWMRRQ